MNKNLSRRHDILTSILSTFKKLTRKENFTWNKSKSPPRSVFWWTLLGDNFDGERPEIFEIMLNGIINASHLKPHGTEEKDVESKEEEEEEEDIGMRVWKYETARTRKFPPQAF